MPPRIEHARAAFLRACGLDVAVRKPGNVSAASPGHGMHAGLFLASAQAAAGPLFDAGTRVGERIERATAASWAAVGCNTNLGIVLLCAPLAAALERDGASSWPEAVEQVLAGLDVDDARAAYRAITLANPGGLGRASAQDVHTEPTLGLREAMALATSRDSIARQYVNGFGDVFGVAAALLPENTEAATTALVQGVYLEFLATWPDSHIVRKHGEALAQTVMSAAQGWRQREQPNLDPAFAAWDESLKARRINPGTSADLTVATLFILLAGCSLGSEPGQPWHGS